MTTQTKIRYAAAASMLTMLLGPWISAVLVGILPNHYIFPAIVTGVVISVVGAMGVTCVLRAAGQAPWLKDEPDDPS